MKPDDAEFELGDYGNNDLPSPWSRRALKCAPQRDPRPLVATLLALQTTDAVKQSFTR
jgi:hypothetical protein